MDNFLDAYDLLKLIHDEINNLNSFITINVIEALIKNLPSKHRSTEPDE